MWGEITLLIIEDDAEEQRIIRRFLHDAGGFAVYGASTLRSGLQLLRERHCQIVLLDLGLPGCQGIETFRKFRPEAGDVPVIVLAGPDDGDAALSAVREGAQDSLWKGELNAALLTRAVRYAVERKRLEERLRESRKMETIGRLAGGVAHDFNNLLTAIQGHAQLILGRRHQDEEAIQRSAGVINQAAGRASSLVNQLLIAGRQQTFQRTALNLNNKLLSMDMILRKVLGESIQLHIQLAADLGCVKADPGQIEQMILNLAMHARDAMPNGGDLTIETGGLVVDHAAGFRTEMSNLRPGRYILLQVTDTGPGISAEERRRLFAPCRHGNGSGRVPGLGLAAVYGAVLHNEGAIRVYSEPGKGTSFQIFLPGTEQEERRDDAVLAIHECPTGSETILIVEDEHLVRTLAKDILSRQGYHVLEAHDPHEALDITRVHASSIQLMITDMVMPGMSGSILGKAVRAQYPHMAVLYISGYSDRVLSDRGDLKPHMHFLQKPFSVNGLAHKVRELLDAAKRSTEMRES